EGLDSKGTEFAKKKPSIVRYFMEEFSKEEYGVDVLKVEVPVAIYHIEGYAENEADIVYSQAAASDVYRSCSTKSRIAFIYLSGGGSNNLLLTRVILLKKAAQDSMDACVDELFGIMV